MRLDAYIRVSQVAGRGGESFQSPGDQERAIREAAKRQGWEIAEVNTEDLDQSGGTADRPGFQRVLERIDRGEVDGIGVIRADRFARNVRVGWECVERIKTANGVFLSATENVDVTSPSGKLVLNTLFGMAAYERDLKTDGWARARKNAAERGVPSNPAPFGYRKGEDGRLVVHPAEAKKVRAAFQARAAGESWSRITKDLRFKSIGRTDWMIKNRTYLGEVRLGDLVNAGAHDPIVTREVWEAAQVSHPRPARSNTPSLLTGIVVCDGCGKNMTASNRRTVPQYRCQAITCDRGPHISKHLIEPHVEAVVFDSLKRISYRLRESTKASADALQDLDGAEAELAAFIEVTSGLASPDQLKAGIKSRREKIEQAKERVVSARRTQTIPEPGRLSELWPDLSVPERRHALRSLVKRVVVRRGQDSVEDRVDIVWADDNLDL